MNKYLIEVFEWFDKINGNSYFSLDITDITTNKLIVSTGLQYGYGDHYRTVAYDELVKLKRVKESDRHNHRLNDRRFIYRKTENCLKKDLVAKVI